MEIRLRPEIAELIKHDVQRGPYRSIDEFVERAVSMLHEQEAWLAANRDEIEAKIQAGYAAAKRGGREQVAHLELDEIPAPDSQRGAELIALDDALTRLAELDPRRSRVIELRVFGGLTHEEAAEVLHVSPQSVLRDWRLAKAWLLRELS